MLRTQEQLPCVAVLVSFNTSCCQTMLRTSHASQHSKWEVRPELNSPAPTLGVRALQPQLSSPHRQDGAAGWRYQHQKSCALMHTGKCNSKWWQTMGERKWGQSGSNYCHAQPQLQGLVGETKYETNEQLGNSFSLKIDSMVLLC